MYEKEEHLTRKGSRVLPKSVQSVGQVRLQGADLSEGVKGMTLHGWGDSCVDETVRGRGEG